MQTSLATRIFNALTLAVGAGGVSYSGPEHRWIFELVFNLSLVAAVILLLYHYRARIPRRVEPIHLIVLGLVIALGGAIWMWRTTPSIAALQAEIIELKQGKTSAPAVVAAPSGNPLRDAIEARLSKQGKKATFLPGSTVTMADGSDGRGPYIAHWDASLDPWPTTADGFTANQLRIFPKKYPKFTTQFDKEKFREAVEKLSDVVNKQAGGILNQSSEFQNFLTLLHIANPSPVPVIKFEEVHRAIAEINEVLFSEQNNLFNSYPRYREELMGLLPDESKDRWQTFKVKFSEFQAGANLVDRAQSHQNDGRLRELSVANIGPLGRAYLESLASIRDWIRLCNQRLDAMARAI